MLFCCSDAETVVMWSVWAELGIMHPYGLSTTIPPEALHTAVKSLAERDACGYLQTCDSHSYNNGIYACR